MKIVENCWDDVSAEHCVYGTHSFDGSTAEIYVYSGLSVWSDDLERMFTLRNEYGVGNCKLVFHGVKSFKWRITPYSLGKDGRPLWGTPTLHEHHGESTGEIHEFFLDGTMHDAPASVWGEIEAEKFALHIL